MQRLPKEYLSRLLRAIVEFDLIEDTDRVLIGLSGGKDSLFMTYALAEMNRQLGKNIHFGAITVNPQFDKDFSEEDLHNFCAQFNIPLHVEKVDIAATVRQQNDKNACFTCSFFRRGAINGYAKEHGYNKIAYAHNHDDAVETFFMNLMYSGQLKTFMPKTYLSRTELTVIRPLLYFREEEMREAIALHGQEPCAPGCPFNGHTKRQRAKELIAEISIENPKLYEHLAASMHENAVGDLWPKVKTRKEMQPFYEKFFSSNRKKVEIIDE